MDNQENLNEEERELVEFTDDNGETVTLEILRYFFYNGEEYVVLGETCDCEECEHEEEEERGCFIMNVVETEENDEEMEEFVPIEDDELYDKLIKVAEANFAEDEQIDE